MSGNGDRRTRSTPPPVSRRLQVYAFDPSLDLDLATARVNRSTLPVPWEELTPGPAGDYVEVVDVDPASRCAYPPVDLDDPHLLARDGLSPSEGSPQFHQQMVYAVAMKTIANFEQALGRRVHWSARRQDERDRWLDPEESYVARLRIYPHALREANAYYSPDKKALLFGYFNAVNLDPREGLPGGMVFSCLSHDIIAHEMTHAILDGIHRRLLEPSNPDVLAFHEAFADLVAIFQRFTLPGLLEHQIQQTRGDLATENLLSQLAAQFGRATRHGGALRDALGSVDPETGRWKRRPADPTEFPRTFEPHARGAILVAALFDAFLAIYDSHTGDLLRIASGGTGVLPDSALHPDLVRRLADEARTVSQRLLRICIRALDYLPPVDVTFGDFLRAMITIDSDLVPEDVRHYRVALIRAFRDRGIFPRGVRTLSVETLRWSKPLPEERELLRSLLPPPNVLRTIAYASDFAPVDGLQELPAAGEDVGGRRMATDEVSQRLVESYQEMGSVRHRTLAREDDKKQEVSDIRKIEHLNERQFARYLHGYLDSKARESEYSREELRSVLGVDLLHEDLKFEVHAVRPTTRVHPDGRTKTELLILITQREKRSLSMASAAAAADGNGSEEQLSYRFRGGCTLLVDPISGEVSYCIVKRLLPSGGVSGRKRFCGSGCRLRGLTRGRDTTSGRWPRDVRKNRRSRFGCCTPTPHARTGYEHLRPEPLVVQLRAASPACGGRRNPGTLLLTTAFIGLNWLAYIYSVSSNRVLQASLGYFINPLVNVALGVLVLRERLRRWQVAGLLLAAVGVLKLTLLGGQVPWIALTLAVSFGFYGLLRKLVSVDGITGLFFETTLLLPLSAGYACFCSPPARRSSAWRAT